MNTNRHETRDNPADRLDGRLLADIGLSADYLPADEADPRFRRPSRRALTLGELVATIVHAGVLSRA